MKRNKATADAYNAWYNAHYYTLNKDTERFKKRARENYKHWYSKLGNRARAAERRKEFTKRNPGYNTANSAKYKATKHSRIAPWANKFFMEEAYRLAVLRTKATGFKWEVDHIVPLRSGLVCGLHCEQNLRVIPKSANSSKGNRTWPDKPETEVGRPPTLL